MKEILTQACAQESQDQARFSDEEELLRRLPVSRRTLFNWRSAEKIPQDYYRDDFQDAFARYLPAEGDSERYPGTEPANMDDSPLLRSATETDGSASQNTVATNNDGVGRAVANNCPGN